MNLDYLMPTRVVMGKDCLFINRSLLAELGKKAFIVTGKNSARANGAYDDAVRALEANGQDHVLFDRVMSNPTECCVYEAAAECKKEGCDFVLAIGGGSPIDAAKAAAVLAVNDIPREKLFARAFSGALPIAAVPTTAGTGSETTPYSVLVDTGSPDESRFPDGRPVVPGPSKRSIGSPLLFPRFAFLDARYTFSLGRNNTVNTAIDALSHAIEGFLCVRANYLSDVLARESIAMILDCFDSLIAFPADPRSLSAAVREKLLLASSIAGIVISQSGTSVVHSMGYMFTLNWGTDHGRANGLLMKSFLMWCRAREKNDPSVSPRIPALCSALGIDMESFCGKLETLLENREKASGAELDTWGAANMKNAANTYIKPSQEEIRRMFKEAVG
ncbi:MAG: iron-containing alcohol dehydrogenase [Treponema sp.]|jgi:alcohol dehydrogenase class IV|nr:iron-containing alcohol dehydrogenase [Treponema sp.]